MAWGDVWDFGRDFRVEPIDLDHNNDGLAAYYNDETDFDGFDDGGGYYFDDEN
jgi:hypothetical protein